MNFLRSLFNLPHPQHRAGYNFALTFLKAGLNPTSLLDVIERQPRLTEYERGAVDALKMNHRLVRALLRRHYG